MGMAFLHGNGGGCSGGLNFEVVAYATEEELSAATPKLTTVGVITSDEITAWDFSATEPTEPLEGMVWISNGTVSTASFNALKKNGIQIYPMQGKQYVAGVWVDVTAKVYLDGGWKELWDGTLYDNGREYAEYTGGWVGGTKNATTIAINIYSYSSGSTKTANKIDLTPWDKLTVNVTSLSGSASSKIMYVNNGSTNVASKSLATGENMISLSSITGEYYIVFTVTSNNYESGLAFDNVKLSQEV